MIKLLVIADDLTGAIDAGVHFAERGITTRVIPVFTPEIPNVNLDESVEVVVINTESRHISPDCAAGQVMRAVRFGLDHGVRFIYKKTDSTLRGNIGAELEALMNATGMDQIPFIPAYPALKRFTRRGYHYLGDQLLHQTKFAEDPLEPVTSSYIPEILQPQTSCETVLLSYPYKKNLDSLAGSGKKILVFDCSSEIDLNRIGGYLEEHNWFSVVAGSAGFAPVFARKLSFLSRDVQSIKITGSCLIINGSLNPVSLEQIRKLEDTSIQSLYLEPSLLNSDMNHQDRWDDLAAKARKILQNGEDILINSITTKKDLQLYLKKKHGFVVPKEVYSNAAERFGHFLARILKTNDVVMMVIIGGDTLMALIREMNIVIIQPIHEILPGVVLSKVKIYDQVIYLVTKPGGFGEKDTLLRIIQSIKN